MPLQRVSHLLYDPRFGGIIPGLESWAFGEENKALGPLSHCTPYVVLHFMSWASSTTITAPAMVTHSNVSPPSRVHTSVTHVTSWVRVRVRARMAVRDVT
jgi:hypothetical protein